MSDHTTLETSGALYFDPTNATLADVEDFCRKARELGLADGTRLYPTRQGIMGPIQSWHFFVPVIPKTP